MDVYGPEKRSAVMRAVKSKGTGPEIKVRRLLHRAGYRYRLHQKDLPGNPDIVFPRRRAAIFVHGCFWHQHPGCPHAERHTYLSGRCLSSSERKRRSERVSA